MPRYLGSRISLLASDLKGTTTESPWNHVGPQSTNHIAAYTQKFANESKTDRLDEQLISPQEDTSSKLQFFGPDKDMPFFLVRATKAPAKPQKFETSQHRCEALCISVNIDGDCFLPLPSNIKDADGSTKPLDVKVDVFFNGDFVGSEYIPSRHKKATDQNFKRTMYFHGRRIDRLLEKPFILVPPGQNADGSLRELKRIKGGDAGTQLRFDIINEALRQHAKSLDSYNESIGGVAQYLRELTSLPHPADLQRPGAHKFGVIDIVVSVGRGRKDDSSKTYLTSPIPIRLRPLPVTYRQSQLTNRMSLFDFGSSRMQGKADDSEALENLHGRTILGVSPARGSQTEKSNPNLFVSSYGLDSPFVPGLSKAHVRPLGLTTGAEQETTPVSNLCLGMPVLQPVQADIGPCQSITPLAKRQKLDYQVSVPRRRGRPPLSRPVPATPPNLLDFASGDSVAKPIDNLISQHGRVMNVPQKTYKGSQAPRTPKSKVKERGLHTPERRTTRQRGLGVDSSILKPYMTESEQMLALAKQAEDSISSRPALLESSAKAETTKEPGNGSILKLKFKNLALLARFHEATDSLQAQASSPLGEDMGDKIIMSSPGHTSSGTRAEYSSPIKAGGRKDELKEPKAPFKPSFLNEDCVITYAQDEVRQIKSERNGKFAEMGILVGVRYILS